jgi:DNA-binding NtrC family response regulator
MSNEQKSILLIDDEPEFRLAIRQGLEMMGFHVIEAASGIGCAECLRDRSVAAVICDIYMPRKEGIATITDIKDVAPHVPVIAITGGNPKMLEVASSIGADKTLSKPFTVARLRDAIAACGVDIPVNQAFNA